MKNKKMINRLEKTLAVFLVVLLLLPSQAVWAGESDIVKVILPQQMTMAGLDETEMGPSNSLQMMFAQLQMKQAELNKEQAMTMLSQIETIQKEQKQAAEYLEVARNLQSEAKSSDSTTAMPGQLQEYMLKNGLAYDTAGNDLLMTGDEWDVAIKSLEIHLENLGAKTQTMMVNVQDYINQYNSYLQGANQQINNNNQALTNITRGQSMYGDSSAGLMITTLIVGMVLGCLVTVAAERFMKKGKQV